MRATEAIASRTGSPEDLILSLSKDEVRAPARMQRARGRGSISAFAANGRTRLATLHEDGCAKIRLPNTHDHSLQAVLINTAGGLTGGDDVRWEATAGPGTSLVLTTQACERIYRSLGTDAEVSVKLTAGANARLDWLPQETILFERGKLRRTLEVDLAEGATLCALEAVILGREAMGEDARSATFRDDWRIRRSGRLIHAEATRLGGAPQERDALSLLDGAGAFATVLYVGADVERRLDGVRALLTGRSGASLVGERLTVRAIAPSGLALRKILGPVVASLAGSLPRLWHI
jgi:urease accessory protein